MKLETSKQVCSNRDASEGRAKERFAERDLENLLLQKFGMPIMSKGQPVASYGLGPDLCPRSGPRPHPLPRLRPRPRPTSSVVWPRARTLKFYQLINDYRSFYLDNI